MEKPDDIDTQAPSAATAAKFPPMVTFVCTKGPKYDAEKRSVSETKADSGRSKSQGKAAANEIALLHEQDDVLSLTTGEGVSEWFDALAYSLWERAHHHDSQWLSQLSTVYGAPFEWVQRLSNTDDKAKDTVPSAAVAAESINSTPRLSGEERRNQFGTTIALVCERMTVGKDLSAQLAALKKKTIDLSSPLLAEVAEQFQLRPTANLTEWTQTENTPSYSTYLMALSRNGWVLQATITLSVNYPRVTPSFALTMKATGSTPDPDLSSVIKHMEVDTNVYCHELFVTSENVLNYLLVLQIRRLQMMFDMYVHILQSTDSRGVMIGRLYERKRRGKDRHLPTRYQADKGVFTHR
ncbi:hypothetical protein SARC_07035 [Sphaeroforma arctica JP610]|uniref:Uncharacterized protein n=1 Tax=Sphaeroforma arctica JP610 TaxID=667725 RepID=A0A0L0FVF2_9EUKA|nr:hypothetical protein SARC_07035 [Sphaeroforma arctica JP610]KNC80599.1 hypothetical protein SARC_07035 [Sphaeroforma arctica JP610]|eukprot:XP_014154501.1 hypothetical protein SARC_07035 [Sphaeroforma arctica JP610]